MKKENIIQFVGFVTDLETKEFIAAWEYYSKAFMTVPGTTILQEGTSTKSKYKYLSQHEFTEPELLFAFMKGRHSKYLKEQRIKVVQTGGYIPVQIGCNYDDDRNIKVMAFLEHELTDIDFYRQLEPYKYLNIYQEYYENCMYSHILEFFTEEKDVPELLLQLKGKGAHSSVFKERSTATAKRLVK